MNLLRGTDHRLRNGWWMLIFIGFVVLTRFSYGPVTRGLRDLGLTDAWLEPMPFLFILLATWAVVRLRKEPLSSVGFQLGRPWFRQAALGLALGVGSLLLAVLLIRMFGGVTLQLDPQRSGLALAYGLYVFLFVSLFEETLFRGFLFQRLVAGAGIWAAQLAFALLFAIGHWDNPGMDGATKVVASIELGLAAVLLGLAYLRTRSLALPIGIHLGWNWAQGYVFGFGVSGTEHPGWWQPVFQGAPQWLSGGEFGPEASVFGILVDLLLIGLLWRWKGLATPHAQAPVEPTADAVAVHRAA